MVAPSSERPKTYRVLHFVDAASGGQNLAMI